jgi:hypothetical protein
MAVDERVLSITERVYDLVEAIRQSLTVDLVP